MNESSWEDCVSSVSVQLSNESVIILLVKLFW